MKHSLISPSGAHRWLKCHRSARLIESHGLEAVNLSDYDTAEDDGFSYAEEGALAHELVALMIAEKFEGQTNHTPYRSMDEIIKDKHYSPDLLDEVRKCVDYVDSWSEEGATFKTFFNVETEVPLTNYLPNGVGNVDLFWVDSLNCLNVLDHKFGYVKVSPMNNPQLYLYVLGVEQLLRASSLNNLGIERVRIHVAQPRLDYFDSYYTSIDEVREWANAENVAYKAQLAFDGEGDYHPSDETCRHCTAKHVCPALNAAAVSVYDKSHTPLEALSDEEVLDMYSKIGIIAKWAKAVENYVKMKAIEGKQWEGLQLVSGSVRRSIPDKYTDEALQILKANGITTEELSGTSLAPLGKLEKAIGKEAVEELLGHLIERKPTAPKLKKINSLTSDFFDDDNNELF